MIPTRLIALLALAASLPLSECTLPGGWSVSITNPNAGSIWYGDSKQTVRWDVSHPSTGNANPKGDLYLAQNDRTQFRYHLGSNFNLTAGQVEVTVPGYTNGIFQVAMISGSETVALSPSFTISED